MSGNTTLRLTSPSFGKLTLRKPRGVIFKLDGLMDDFTPASWYSVQWLDSATHTLMGGWWLTCCLAQDGIERLSAAAKMRRAIAGHSESGNKHDSLNVAAGSCCLVQQS
eukprot:TRINITY_DN10660_c0_g1_i4.p2 TRINITY_DN10660_c0_g1~~TRINITY_DN10660_c0_g1_i4.p2  ORF type:complete len:109 (-),score=1.95 TRINITY_DN10660_c0_g1_i4:62-388(-)